MRQVNTGLLLTSTFFVCSLSYPVAEVEPLVSFLQLTPPGNSVASDKNDVVIHQTKLITFAPEFPDSGRKYAVKETESLVSQKDTLYGRAQEFVAGFYNPKPIVDTIGEHEKYGNDGDQFRTIGTAIIGGVEGLSNFLNSVVEKPFEAVKTFGKKVSASLNTLGGKLVGLA